MDDFDVKITKKIFPRANDKKILEFNLGKDSNNFLRKNNIVIHGECELHKDFVVENGFASKLFSQLQVWIESQQVSVNKTR